ncbi:CMRF35-like molecule 6 [Alosa sapidissima]|uniref:CMRF35-like molecule 6 n=1 Tax=Alosa sapidissima TaxID=34773 RepID=UPI001C0A5282|nr:CMRF35-like molecule 6 [Alosa sapidissima]
MNTSIKLILLHFHVLSCVRHKVIQVRGYEGGDAVLDCPSKKGYESSPKYLRRVKNEQENPVEVIHSDGIAEWTHRGRVSLLDMKDKDIFTVTIHNLTLEDSNMYWCGVDVTFIQGTTPTLVIPEYTTGGSTATNKNTSGVFISASVAAAAVSILMIILVTGVLYMQRRQRRERPTEVQA